MFNTAGNPKSEDFGSLFILFIYVLDFGNISVSRIIRV
jgi:hypothetical protein